MKAASIVLSGCGNKDGSEIFETAAAVLYLSELKVQYKFFAPNRNFSAINFITGSPVGERNVLTEAARIARGEITDLSDLHSRDFDALIFPGGYGAAKNLCDWAEAGSKAKVLPDVARVIQEFYSEKKPIGAICIAPVLLALTLGKDGVTVTVGDDPETEAEIRKTGAYTAQCKVDDYFSDRDHKIVSTPAFMFDGATVAQVFKGIHGAIREICEMA